MTTRPHPVSARALSAPVLHFDLQAEIKRLRGEPDWTSGKRSITLTKDGSLRVVLMALRAGASLEEHGAASAVTVHVLEGSVCITVEDHAVMLMTGGLLTLEPELRHSVAAADDSVLLLTLSLPAKS